MGWTSTGWTPWWTCSPDSVADGREAVLVSSGAIATGLAPLGLSRRPRDLATQQAAASVGQGLLIGRYAAAFGRHSRTVGQVLLTVDDVTRRAHYRNAYRTLRQLLELGTVPIVNENDTVATDEIRFGDNDRLAALVAALVHADLLVLLSDVDALWTGDPSRPDSRRIGGGRARRRPRRRAPSGRRGRAGVGTGGMVTKVEAARIATGAGIPVVLTAARARRAGAAPASTVGTLFHPAPAAPGRPAVLAGPRHHAPRPAVPGRTARSPPWCDRRKSLLPAGITAVDGALHRRRPGGPGRRRRPPGRPRAGQLRRGGAARRCSAAPPANCAAALGPEYEREVVHRDDLVLL